MLPHKLTANDYISSEKGHGPWQWKIYEQSVNEKMMLTLQTVILQLLSDVTMHLFHYWLVQSSLLLVTWTLFAFQSFLDPYALPVKISFAANCLFELKFLPGWWGHHSFWWLAIPLRWLTILNGSINFNPHVQNGFQHLTSPFLMVQHWNHTISDSIAQARPSESKVHHISLISWMPQPLDDLSVDHYRDMAMGQVTYEFAIWLGPGITIQLYQLFKK